MANLRLKYPATCKECGSHLPIGAEARYYGRGKVYGVTCHGDTRPLRQALSGADAMQRAANDFIDVDRIWEDQCSERCGL